MKGLLTETIDIFGLSPETTYFWLEIPNDGTYKLVSYVGYPDCRETVSGKMAKTSGIVRSMTLQVPGGSSPIVAIDFRCDVDTALRLFANRRPNKYMSRISSLFLSWDLGKIAVIRVFAVPTVSGIKRIASLLNRGDESCTR